MYGAPSSRAGPPNPETERWRDMRRRSARAGSRATRRPLRRCTQSSRRSGRMSLPHARTSVSACDTSAGGPSLDSGAGTDRGSSWRGRPPLPRVHPVREVKTSRACEPFDRAVTEAAPPCSPPVRLRGHDDEPLFDADALERVGDPALSGRRDGRERHDSCPSPASARPATSRAT